MYKYSFIIKILKQYLQTHTRKAIHMEQTIFCYYYFNVTLQQRKKWFTVIYLYLLQKIAIQL
jgi:hypothetical protein